MDFRKLTEFVDTLPAYGIPGGDVTVWQNHTPLYRHSAGYSDLAAKTPISGNELYFMYSCTKVFTCVAMLQLFERGKFLMSDPLSDFLPEFANVTVRHGECNLPAEKPILMRHLFSMSAGLNYNLTNAYIQDVAERTNGRCPTREIAAAIAKIPLEFEPGTSFHYSLCHDVLAAVLEVITGEKFGDYVKKNILDPCGMTESTFYLTEAVLNRIAPQYRYNDRRGMAMPTPKSNMYILGSEYHSGGAGLISCLDDCIKFLDAMACGGVSATGNRILSEATISMMRENCLNDEGMQRFHREFPQFIGYGYGFGVRTLLDRSEGILSPIGEFGWGGAAGSYMLIDPVNHISMFYAQHMLNNKEGYVHTRLRNTLYAGLDS